MKINSKILMQSAKHVAWVFAAAVLIGEFWAIPVWLRVGYAAALLAAWILVYKIEIAISQKWPKSLRSQMPVASPTANASVLPARREQERFSPTSPDEFMQREDDVIAALVDLGYSRKEAAKISRKPSHTMARIAAEAPARKPHTSWDSFQADKARA